MCMIVTVLVVSCAGVASLPLGTETVTGKVAEALLMFEVAVASTVIDEAQLVADDDRGHSWTRAILGTKAKEIHVCMSPVAKDVVTHLIGLCGDEYDTTLVKKMFLFGLTTIDLNYVCNGEFKTSNSEFITIDEHTINTSRQTNKNTRKFIDNYSYSDITLNLTAFLNAYTDDSMFARTALYRPNAPEGTEELVTKISDVKIRFKAFS